MPAKVKEENTQKYPQRMGQPWSENEQNQLLQEIQKKIPIDMIAELHERTNGSITSRLREIAANYYFNNNLQVTEIQKFTGLTIEQISDAIARREYQDRIKSEKQKPKKIERAMPTPTTVRNLSEETNDTKEIISLLKDIKVLLETFLNNIHYEE